MPDTKWVVEVRPKAGGFWNDFEYCDTEQEAWEVVGRASESDNDYGIFETEYRIREKVAQKDA